ADAWRDRQDLLGGPQRAGLEPRRRHQLADDAVQPIGLLDDDREARVRLLRAHLLGVGADARQRRLEVVADAAEELVLGLVELDESLATLVDLVGELDVTA